MRNCIRHSDALVLAPPYVAAAGVSPPCVVIYNEAAVKWSGKLPGSSQEVIDHAK